MTSPDLVSVVIPFHNSERFLAEAIDSVIRQSWSSWELILVDDGSSDRSRDIVLSYAGSGARIHLTQHEGRRNLGLTRSRNLGARASSGEFLAFLDSDDVWLPHKLEHLVGILREHPRADMVCGPSKYWYDWDTENTRQNVIPAIAPGETLYQPPALFLMTYPIGPHGAPCPSSILVRQTAFERVGGFEDAFNPSTFQIFEDTAFFTKIYLSGPVYVTSACTDRYRRHAGSMWEAARHSSLEERARRFYFKWLRNYLGQRQPQLPGVLRAARQAGWPHLLPLPPVATRALCRIANRMWNPK
ncbi:MAG TPA: glycosyltransferase family 2 protein [Terracidiphilus sp.]|nr:glycosyltransferase family 2 protein [Terracidiphilus sp.]